MSELRESPASARRRKTIEEGELTQIVETSSGFISTEEELQSKKGKQRCGNCVGCWTDDCGVCPACLDMPKNGGPGTLKEVCW